MPFCIGWVENCDEIALSCMVKEIEEHFRFSIFGKNSKWLPYVGRGIFFLKTAKGTLVRYPVGSLKSLYLARLRRQKQTCIFFILGNN